ncbi:MAG: type II toxin-antitoxin system YhaV family toxin [Chloroflexota bacterium]
MPLIVNGWVLLYHPAFGNRYAGLRDETRRLKSRLPDDQYRTHPLVKLTASVRRLVLEIVPLNPNSEEFHLHGDLAAFRRAKGHGLPPRYRLFWVFSSQIHTIIFLYLNDDATLRKEGADTDPYAVFRQMIDRGAVGDDFDANLERWKQARNDTD